MFANHYVAAVRRDPRATSPSTAPAAERRHVLPFVLVTGPSVLWGIGANFGFTWESCPRF